MDVWVVIIGLLALSIIFLFISLFLKDNDYEEELDEMSDNILELNREIYYLKQKLQETEVPNQVMNTAKYEEEYMTQTPVAPVAMEEELAAEEMVEPVMETISVTETFPNVELESDSKKMQNITKQHIITLYSQGCEMEEIAEQLAVPISTVQLVIENYFEVDPS